MTTAGGALMERWIGRIGAVLLLAIVLSLGFNITYGARDMAALKPEEAYWAEELQRDLPLVKVNETVMAMVEEYSSQILKEFNEELCTMSDEEMLHEGLTKDDIKKAKAFCRLPDAAKLKIIRNRLLLSVYLNNPRCSALKQTEMKPIITASSGGTYSCRDGLVYAWGIPTKEKLGISHCSWRKSGSPSSCSKEKGVACLWGCTNVDTKLGWLGNYKSFPNLDSFVQEVTSKGYHKTDWYAAYGIYGRDFTRGIGYGYRYEARYSPETRMGYVEGPEPNPEKNWYGFLHNFWPTLVKRWHDKC